MPSDPDGGALEREIAKAIRDVGVQLGKVRAEVKEDMAQLLRAYREDTHRTMLGIHTRIVSLEDTFETDRALRITRQQRLDAILDAIQRNQRWWIRSVIAVVLIVIGVAAGVWLF